MHKHVVSFDLNSLYPSIIMQFNMSPETIKNEYSPELDVETVLSKPNINRPDNTAIAVGGQHFDISQQGVLPKIIEEMYDERVEVKKNQIKYQKQLQKAEDKQTIFELQRQISLAENRQMSIKILLNSLYGALGNRYFRFFDQRIAEAITLSGQAIIRWGENAINDYLNNLLKTKKDYVITIDTDSLYVGLGDLVEKFNPKNKIDFLDTICQDKLEPVFEKSYQEFYDKFGGLSNKLSLIHI